MWAKFIVEAQSKSQRETRLVEVGCMGEAEAVKIGRIWFPPDRYEGHRAYRKLGIERKAASTH